jgi:hypothetical protein
MLPPPHAEPEGSGRAYRKPDAPPLAQHRRGVAGVTGLVLMQRVAHVRVEGATRRQRPVQADCG